MFLCFSSISFCFSARHGLSAYPEDLGDNFDGADAASFSFEDFDLDGVPFPQAVTGTSSTATAGTSSGSSSRPRLS